MPNEEARLRWLCRRGMKELDLVLSAYLERHYASASSADRANFESLLQMSDPELYALMLGRDPAQTPALAEFIRLLHSAVNDK